MEPASQVSKAWKDFERLVALMTGGLRTWWTSVDVTLYQEDQEGAYWGIECKHLKNMTLADIERAVDYANERSAKMNIPPERTALAVKRVGGRGTKTKVLLIYELHPPEETHGN